jgi:hypothetical protein
VYQAIAQGLGLPEVEKMAENLARQLLELLPPEFLQSPKQTSESESNTDSTVYNPDSEELSSPSPSSSSSSSLLVMQKCDLLCGILTESAVAVCRWVGQRFDLLSEGTDPKSSLRTQKLAILLIRPQAWLMLAAQLSLLAERHVNLNCSQIQISC